MIEPLLDSEEAIGNWITAHQAALLYFSTPDCKVCKTVRPLIEQLLRESFPEMASAGIDCSAAPALSASRTIFNIPTIVIYFDGKETQRLVRNISMGELRELIARPYSMLFGE